MRPLVIARGGASAAAPEHTIAAFEIAIAEGADALGFRVRLTRDGHPVVFGPSVLERTTDGHGPLSAHTVRDLKRLDAGGRRDPRFGGQRIQTLHEVLERFRDRTRFLIELPPGGDAQGDLEERVVSTIEIYDAVGSCEVQSDDLPALGRLRSLSRELPLGLIWRSGALDRALRTPDVVALCVAAHVVRAADVATIQAAGLRCYVGNADEPALVDRLVGWRVDGVSTDHPGMARTRIDRSEPLG